MMANARMKILNGKFVKSECGESPSTYSFRWLQLRHHFLVALGVALAEGLHQPLNLLRLSRHPEVTLELPQRDIDGGARQVQLLAERVQHGHVERLLDHPEVLADHESRQSFAGDEKLRDAHGSVLQKAWNERKVLASLEFTMRNRIYRFWRGTRFPFRASCWTSWARCGTSAFWWSPKSWNSPTRCFSSNAHGDGDDSCRHRCRRLCASTAATRRALRNCRTEVSRWTRCSRCPTTAPTASFRCWLKLELKLK